MSRLVVTTASLPSDDVFLRVQPGLLAQLPLRDLTWKTTSSQRGAGAGRPIALLDLDLRPIQSITPEDDRRQQGPMAATGLMEKPYLHLLFVACDDNDVYRATIRAQVRDWLDGVAARRSPEWLIVLVDVSGAGGQAGAAAASSAKFYQRRGAVIDKLRADFNAGKRDRCVAITLPAEGGARLADPALWGELMVKIKDSVVATFDLNVTAFEDDVRKLDSQRSLPGWNFCTFFIQKEGLAHTFEAMNLLEDALVQYDELEASFYNSMSESSMAWFGKLGGVDAGDDAISLFASPAPKPYRDLIRSNAITVFDFRCYLAARQGSLLGRLGLVTELARRGSNFIASVAALLREQSSALSPHFVESWTYGTALDIVDHCERSLRQNGLDAARAPAGYLAAKASLLDLARTQLERIGVRVGHLPSRVPFEMSLAEPTGEVSLTVSQTPTTETMRVPQMISRREVVGAVADRAKFDGLYTSAARRAIEAYMACGRRRFAVKLHACLAALEQARGKADSAPRLYTQLPSHYVDTHWARIEASLLRPCIDLQSELKLSDDQLLSTLSLLRAGLDPSTSAWTLDSDDPAALVADVAALSRRLDKDFAAIAFPTFTVSVVDERGSIPADEDGAVVEAVIVNRLPCDVAIDEVRLKLSAREHVWFTSAAAVLRPGRNLVRVQSNVPICGAFVLDLAQIRLARIIFQYSYAASDKPRSVIYFAEDVDALHVALEAPQEVALDRPRHALFVLRSGRNDISRAVIKVRPASGVTFSCSAASLLDQVGSTVLKPTADALELQVVPRQTSVRISLPFAITTSAASVAVQIDVEYRSASKRKHVLHSTASLQLALPLGVNVQDFFRPDRLISKFIISADTEPLRIASVVADEHAAVEVRSARPPDAESLVVMPDNPATYLFRVSRKPGAGRPIEQQLRLGIRYRSIREEALDLVSEVVRIALGQHDLARLSAIARRVAEHIVPPSTDLTLFALLGKLERTPPSEPKLAELARRFCRSEAEASGLAAALVVACSMTLPPASTLEWRQLSLPVDVPAVDLLATAKLAVQSGRSTIGELVAARLSVTVSSTWASSSAPSSEVRLLYDIVTSTADWLITGRKRAEFRLAPDGVQTHEVDLALVPMRAGRLPVPGVVVSALPAGGSTSIETFHANAAETVEIVPEPVRSTFMVDLNAPPSILAPS